MGGGGRRLDERLQGAASRGRGRIPHPHPHPDSAPIVCCLPLRFGKVNYQGQSRESMPGQRRGRGGGKDRGKYAGETPHQRPKTQPHSTPVSDRVTVTAGPNACKKQEEVFLGGRLSS